MISWNSFLRNKQKEKRTESIFGYFTLVYGSVYIVRRWTDFTHNFYQSAVTEQRTNRVKELEESEILFLRNKDVNKFV